MIIISKTYQIWKKAWVWDPNFLIMDTYALGIAKIEILDVYSTQEIWQKKGNFSQYAQKKKKNFMLWFTSNIFIWVFFVITKRCKSQMEEFFCFLIDFSRTH